MYTCDDCGQNSEKAVQLRKTAEAVTKDPSKPEIYACHECYEKQRRELYSLANIKDYDNPRFQYIASYVHKKTF